MAASVSSRHSWETRATTGEVWNSSRSSRTHRVHTLAAWRILESNNAIAAIVSADNATRLKSRFRIPGKISLFNNSRVAASVGGWARCRLGLNSASPSARMARAISTASVQFICRSSNSGRWAPYECTETHSWPRHAPMDDFANLAATRKHASLCGIPTKL